MRKSFNLTRTLMTFALIAVVLLGSLASTACNESEIRTNIKDAVAGGRAVLNSVAVALPKDDPRIIAVQQWSAALDRFQAAFDNANSAEERKASVALFADILTAFDTAVLPLLPMGGLVAIAIIGADTALRFLANRLNRMVAAVIDTRGKTGLKLKLAVLMLPGKVRPMVQAGLTADQWTALERCRDVTARYLATEPAASRVPPAQRDAAALSISWQMLRTRFAT